MIRGVSQPAIATAAIILAVACAEGDDRVSLERVGTESETSPDTQEVRPQVPAPRKGRLDSHGNVIADTFNVRYDLRGDRLTMILDTDLPDETTLMADVYRTYKQTGGYEDYVVDYYSKRSTVGEWRRPQSVRLDNDRWRTELDRARRISAAAGDPFSVASISENVTISLTVPINQSSSLFKQGNSNLRGSVVEESPWGRVIHGELELNFPLDARGILSVEWADPLALEPGRTYRLSRETPLMPETSPSNPIEAIAQVRYLEPGTEFTVRDSRSVAGAPWYLCTIQLDEGVAEGWINSTALIGQDLEALR